MKKNWSIGFCAILLSISAVFSTAHLQKKFILNEAKVNLINLVGSVEMDLERALYGLNQVFLGVQNYLEAASEHGPADATAVHRILENLKQENQLLTALLVLDATGKVSYWTNNIQKPNLEQRDYFKAHKEGSPGDFFIGSPQESVLNKGQWIFGVSRAFRDSNGKLIRVISAIIDTSQLSRSYQSLFERSRAELSVLSADCKVYVRVPEHLAHVGHIDPCFSVTQPPEKDVGTIKHQTSPTGDRYLTITHHIDQYPLFVSVRKSDKDIFAQWRAEIWIYYLLGIGISLALLLLTYRTVRSQQQRRESTRQLHLQAISDPLTGLFNRRYILDQAKLELLKAQRQESSLSIIMLDLDEFKQVNDNCGHDVGDQVLVEMARLLKEKCRNTDIISRYGGEEFLMVLPGTDLSGALHIAEKCRQALEARIFEGPCGKFRVTGSFGVVQYQNTEELGNGIKRADEALYQAKKEGRNQVVKAQHKVTPLEQDSSMFWIEKRR